MAEARLEPAAGCPEIIAALDLSRPGLLEASAENRIVTEAAAHWTRPSSRA